jgi:GGDEF domain-containing protein
MHPNPYQSLVSLLSNILEAYTTAFFIVDLKNRQLNLVASQTLSKYLPENVSLPLEQSGILAQVQKVGQTIHLEKLQEAAPSLSSTVPFYRDGESHIKGLFALPVGDGAGVLYVDTKYSWGFNDKQQKWIREIAGVLNELLQRQECMRQEQDHVRMLDLWRRVDEAHFKENAPEEYCRLVVSECAQFLGAEYGFLALKEAGKQNYHVLATTPNAPRNLTSQQMTVKHGLIGHILQNKKPLLIGRLNSQNSDHFLFTSSEGLPHHGTFWGFPTQLSLGHTMAMAFLSRRLIEWSTDDQKAVSHVLQSFRLVLEQYYFKEECNHLRTYDFASGLLNGLAFEARVESILTSSMQNSTPLTLALIQFEPWQLLPVKATPKQVRKWLADLASSFSEALPANVLLGQLAENRIGLVFTGTSPQDAKHHLSQLIDLGQRFFATRIKGIRVQAYYGSVGYPQDGTRSEELWPLVYRQLYSAIRGKN